MIGEASSIPAERQRLEADDAKDLAWEREWEAEKRFTFEGVPVPPREPRQP